MANERNSNVAFLFPGQGAQAVGMGADIYASSPAGRAVFEQADGVLGFSLSRLIFEGPSEELRQTENAQPAILCASVAYLRAMEEMLGARMPTPQFVAGHSLGEYTALVASGALSLEVGLRLIRRRGELMQAAGARLPSGMAAVLGLDMEQTLAVCREAGVQLANVNTADQLVIAGTIEALQKATQLAQQRGARRVVVLEVSAAFHSEVMRSAQEELDRAVGGMQVNETAVPLIANTLARPITTPDEIRTELAQQLCGCVLWYQSMEYMLAQGVTRFIEIGPGKVLTGLAKRIAPHAETVAVGDLDALTALTVS